MQPKTLYLTSVSAFAGQVLLLTLFLFSNACNTLTTKETTIKGLVYDQALEAPVAGINVYLFQEEVSPMPFGPISGESIAFTTTDAQGKFSFNEKLVDRSKFDYLVIVDTEGKSYFESGWSELNFDRVTQKVEIEAGSSNQATLPQASFANYRLTAENRSVHPNLEFSGFLVRNHTEFGVYGYNVAAGSSVENDQLVPVPSGLNQIKWRIKGSGIDTTIIEEINVIPHQKQDYHFVFEG